MSARCTFAHVDLGALQSNFRAISEFLAEEGPPEGGHYRDDSAHGDARSGSVRLPPSREATADHRSRGEGGQPDRVTPGVIAVVKANAYGHGAPAVGLALQEAGATILACADIEEGVVLRKAGVTAEILIF